MSVWSRKCTLRFIEQYRSHECTWRVKCKAYHNREMRDTAYKELLDFVRKFDPDATKDTITKKINNLRCSFRKEYKKVQRSQKSKMITGQLYVPKLWYYNELLFLLNQEETYDDKSISCYQPQQFQVSCFDHL